MKLDMLHDYNEIVGDLIEESGECFWDDYEVYGDYRDVEEIESRSRDGFWSKNDGGWTASALVSLSYMNGSGNFPSNVDVEDILRARVDTNYEQAKEHFINEHNDTLIELGYVDEDGEVDSDRIDYHSLYDDGNGLLAEKLSEYEEEWLEDETVLIEIGAMYYDEDSYHSNFEGKQSMYVWGVYNWEAPYHRNKSDYEWSVIREFTFDNEVDLKEKLSKAIKEIKEEMGYKE